MIFGIMFKLVQDSCFFMILIFELSTLAIHLTVSTYTAAIELIIMAYLYCHNWNSIKQ